MATLNSEKLRNWRAANPEARRAQKRRHYAKHAAEINEARRVKRLADPEKFRAQKRRQYQANREIIRAKQNAERAANREKYLRQQREWRAKNRAVCLLHDVRKRSKQRGLDCDLTVGWIEERFMAGVCEMSGMPFDMTGRRSPNAPSIDRIDPKGPYTSANCRMILWALNRALSNYGQEYMLDLFRAVLWKAPQ